MAMFQIQQLSSTKYVSTDQQKQVYGSGAGPHLYVAPSQERQEELWQGYADGNYNLEVQNGYNSSTGIYAVFNRDTSRAGVIKV
jgi:hypothetical protein